MKMENWIGEAVGLMHVHGISQAEVATHIGIRRDYFSKIINGKKAPKGSEERIMNAIHSIIEQKGGSLQG